MHNAALPVPDESIRLVWVTVPDEATGQTLARALVTERLAACVSLMPVLASVYVWDGECCETAEVQLLIKTTQGALPILQQRVHQLHPYQVPEWIVVAAESVSPTYQQWVVSHVATPSPSHQDVSRP
jgi:periplasmic divalent cation tolerance protein